MASDYLGDLQFLVEYLRDRQDPRKYHPFRQDLYDNMVKLERDYPDVDADVAEEMVDFFRVATGAFERSGRVATRDLDAQGAEYTCKYYTAALIAADQKELNRLDDATYDMVNDILTDGRNVLDKITRAGRRDGVLPSRSRTRERTDGRERSDRSRLPTRGVSDRDAPAASDRATLRVRGRDQPPPAPRLATRPVAKETPVPAPEPKTEATPKDTKLGITVPTTLRKQAMSITYIPQLPHFDETYYDPFTDGRTWRTAFHSTRQIPVFGMTNGAIRDERILDKNDELALKIMANFEKNRSDEMSESHNSYLLMPNNYGLSKRDMNIDEGNNLLNNIMANIEDVDVEDAPVFFGKNIDASKCYHFKGIFNSLNGDYGADMYCLINDLVGDHELTIDPDDMAFCAVIQSIYPYSIPCSPAVDKIIMELKSRRTHHTLAESLMALRHHTRPAQWASLNNAATAHLNEILAIEMNIEFVIDNYCTSITELLQRVQQEYGDVALNMLQQQARRIVELSLPFNAVCDEDPENPNGVNHRWVVEEKSLVVHLPTMGANLDVAVSDSHGTAMISSTATPGLYEMATRMIERAKDCRRIVLVTNDNAKAYIYTSPIGNSPLISNRSNIMA